MGLRVDVTGVSSFLSRRGVGVLERLDPAAVDRPAGSPRGSTTVRPGSFRLGIDGRVLDDRYHGIGRVTEALLRCLTGRPDVDVVVFLRRDQCSRRFDVPALTAGLGHTTATFDSPLDSPLQWLRWPGAIRAAAVDSVLFPYNLGAAVWGRAQRHTIVHDCILESDPAFAPSALTRALYMAATSVVVRRDRVITPTAASAAAVQETYGVPADAVTVIPWGVETAFRGARARPEEDAGSATAARTLPAPGSYLLHVGARRPHKNVVTLVRALARLPEDLDLVLVGPVDRRTPDPVPEVAEELGVAGRVVHLPHVSEADLIALYRGAQAFVYPSLVEGFGLPLLEAMAAGAPVVASDIPVFREVSRGAAELVPVSDPGAWAEAVMGLRDPARRAQLVHAGHEVARTATWSRTTDALVAALRPSSVRA
ncbi:glycosyltransferase family 4 protein [Modestobacter marinus]|uniref:glycosyltransferase family 4 protein n=1 Tax=Modestobacter marinus TaxID=477641 RepID=UPI001C97523F|nr:glycosyltransferase family 1 protein [Modestobacter marinus]